MQLTQPRSRRGYSTVVGFIVLLIYFAVSTPLLYLRIFYPLTNRARIHPFNAKPFLTLANDETTILLNAGQGTTGTTTVMEATCRLGIPGFHYHASCVPYQTLFSKRDEYLRKYNRVLDTKKNLHDKLMKNYYYIRECAYPRRKTWWQRLVHDAMVKCTMTRFVEVLQESKALLDELLKQPGSFSLHDSPYPYFLDYILQQAQAGDVPRKISLVLSERESVSWSSRRIRKHREALVCREHFKEIINGRMALGIDSDGEDNFYYAGAFDLIACVDYARKQDPPPHFVSDAIISYRGLGEICDSYKDRATQCHTRLSEINARALTEYQDRVRQLYIPDFMINLWDKKVTIEDIAKNLYNVVPKLQNMVNRVEMVKRGGRRDGKVLPLIINAKD